MQLSIMSRYRVLYDEKNTDRLLVSRKRTFNTLLEARNFALTIKNNHENGIVVIGKPIIEEVFK